ncbi:MAG: hypothetical protein FJ265_11805 [Planctomycetes bacterium]|nr:hypothetical protein [Planctomycetota bacterium]
MKNCSLLLLALFVAAPPVCAHGGQYRGPGEVVPPGPGKTGATSGSPASTPGRSAPNSGPVPSSPAPSASAPTPSGTAAAASSGARPRGVTLEDDLTRWEFWWEFGKDPYLRLREAVGGRGALGGSDDALLNPRLGHRARNLEPTSAADRTRIAEALVAVLQDARDRDTISACLVALAKLGCNGAGRGLFQLTVPFLASNDQELRETAALALGISGQLDETTTGLLSSLARDDETGRKACGRSEVNERTRAFAAFGLGLLLRRCDEVAVARRVVDGLLPALRAEGAGRDLQVAAIEALAQFPRDWSAPGAVLLREAIVDELGAFYRRPLPPGLQLVQAHVPPAIAHLVRPGEPRAAHWQKVFAADLAASMAYTGDADPAAKVNPHVAQSCALALGHLSAPWTDERARDHELCALLLRAYRSHRDQQVRSFALLALGHAGGELARTRLVAELATAGAVLERPWVAVALGVLGARERAEAARAGRTAVADPTVGKALRAALEDTRNGQVLGAIAVALGLCGEEVAADSLRELLRRHQKRDDVAGYLCIALGLLGDHLAAGEVRELLRGAERRPELLLQSARALGLLGDHEVVPELCRQLESPDPSLARLSAAAAALGQIGDRRSIEPLLRMATNPHLTPLTRAFAVVALGSIGDKDPLPWNTAYATVTNYRAATSTLTDGSAGVLDIL